MARRKITPIQALSIDTMAGSFALALRSERRSENTVYSYLLSVRLFAEFLKEHDRPLTIDATRDDIRAFIIDQTKRNSASTALVRYKSLQAFFKFIVSENELDASPMTGMKAPTVKRGAPPIVSDDVLTKLLKTRAGTTLGDRRDSALLRTFIDTGCRLSEVTNLAQGDVNRTHQTITVTGKGDRERTVAVGNKALLAIDRYLRQLGSERPENVGTDKALWVGRAGGMMSTSGITDVLHRMCEDAGVARLHWHQFRHTYADAWLRSGASDSDLMDQAGWRSRSMLEVYARATRQERSHATARRLSLGDRV